MEEIDKPDDAISMRDLDEQIQQYYGDRRLSAARLDRVLHSDGVERKRRKVLSVGMAACVAGLAGSLTGALLYRQGSLSERTRSTMREAALNHVTQLSIEFDASTVAELNQRMQLLPFNVTLPGSLDEDLNLLGARYCTVSGNLAVHLKLINQASRRNVSLFMTPVFDDLEAIEEEGINIDGINVEMWQEQGMFYAMAH
ncbi:MAG: hypothetical protein AB8B87_03090 [Granulosicoccus sp.]